jgi:ABC-type transport system involved in Fe-S cluster assembly fused permease/ATPase subunit
MMNVVDDYWSLKKREFTQEILNVSTLDVLANLFTQNEFSGRVNFDENLKTRQRINIKSSTSVNLYCFLQNKVTIDTLMLKL